VIAILGAGLTGLSVALHLRGDWLLLERDAEPGGLCRSYQRAGFWFDHSAHLLNLRSLEIAELVETLLPGVFVPHERRSFVHSHGTLVPFPFQAHLYALPRAVTEECLLGYLRAQRAREGPVPAEASLRAWALASFGEGIARHFFLPYNEKLWCCDLREMLVDETQWSIPLPAPEIVVRGALGADTQGLGYNPVFGYPASGGIGVLALALGREIERRRPGGLRLGEALLEVDLERRELHTSRGATLGFDSLVSTLPLPELIARIRRRPDAVVAAAAALRHVSVACVNLGFERPAMSERHWIYFPGAEFAFFRLGCYSAFSAAPGSSFYVEFSRPGGAPLPADLLDRTLAGMRRAGIVREGEQPCVADVIDIPFAYVVHDRARLRALPVLRSFLAAHAVHSVGRYGDWQYSSMEEALLGGRKVAESLS
jgi:protoporphyrinogen oxidase